MKPIRFWVRFPGRVTALFFGIATVSACALIFLGVRLFEQDRALQAQRLQEKRESAADRLVAALELALSAEERRLADRPEGANPEVGPGAVLLAADHTAIRVWPDGALLYQPVAPTVQEPPVAPFLAAEKSEFVDRDYDRAIEIIRALSSSPDPAVRTGAQLRLARNLRKAGRADAALAMYGALDKATSVGLSGVPADLVARRARCVLLEELQRSEQLRQEAQSLYRDLRAGRWRLDRASYLYYAGQVMRWIQTEPGRDAQRQVLADAVAWLWQSWRAARIVEPGSSGRRCLGSPETPVTVLWRASSDRVAALVAGGDYQQSHWFQPALKNLDNAGVRAAFLDGDGKVLYGGIAPAGFPETRRAASTTGLPWTLAISNSDVQAEMEQLAGRRRLLLVGLVALALLLTAGSYLIGRAGVARIGGGAAPV